MDYNVSTKEVRIINNPRAFPLDFVDRGEHQRGMTLRDYFAAKAMQTLLAMPVGVENVSEKMRSLAGGAYEIADSMLKERNK